MTGIFNSPSLGGAGFVTDWVTASVGYTSIGEQFMVQLKAVLIVIAWSGVVSAVGFYIVKFTVGLRVTEEEEREGLDISAHGERAYTA
jgi:ammonium transporter, Amt family